MMMIYDNDENQTTINGSDPLEFDIKASSELLHMKPKNGIESRPTITIPSFPSPRNQNTFSTSQPY